MKLRDSKIVGALRIGEEQYDKIEEEMNGLMMELIAERTILRIEEFVEN